MAFVHDPNGPVSIDVIRQSQAEAICSGLDAIDGQKTVLVEDELFTALPSVLDLKTLEKHGVAFTAPLTTKMPMRASEIVVYIMRPSAHCLHLVGDHILEQRKSESKRQFHAFFVTRFPRSVEKLLDCYKGSNLFAELDKRTKNLDLHWFPLDNDVLSMELPFATRTALVEHSLVDAHSFALGLYEIEKYYGPFARVRGKGDIAYRVAQTLRQHRAENGTYDFEPGKRPEIRELIIIDRSFDSITPLMTQLTYEGLIYEAFKTRVMQPNKLNSIACNTMDVDGPMLDYGPDTVIHVALCSNDPVLKLIRDEPMGKAVKKVAKEIEEASKLYKATNDLQSKSISHLKEYTLALKETKEKEPYLALHNRVIKHIRTVTSTRTFSQIIGLNSSLVQSRIGSLSWGSVLGQIETMILSQLPLEGVLRLLALVSLTQDGIDPKRLDSIRRLIVECYGHQHVLTLMNLETAGFLTPKTVSSSQSRWFGKVAKKLGLVFDDSKADEEDIAKNSFASYQPLSTQFIRFCLGGSDSKDAGQTDSSKGAIADSLALIPGEYFDMSQAVSAQAPKNVIAVAFFGGVTAAEIAILRSIAVGMGGRDDQTPEILILTTGITEGDSFIAQFNQGILPTGPYDPRDFAHSGLFKDPSLWDVRPVGKRQGAQPPQGQPAGK